MTQCNMHSDEWDCAAYGYRDDGVHEPRAMPSYLGDLSRTYCERGSTVVGGWGGGRRKDGAQEQSIHGTASKESSRLFWLRRPHRLGSKV